MHENSAISEEVAMVETIPTVLVGILLVILVITIRGDPFEYTITQRAITVRLFRGIISLEIIEIPFVRIRNLETIPMWKAHAFILIPFLRLGLSLWGQRAVIIRKKSGIFRFMIITPPDPDAFVEGVRQKMPKVRR